MSDTATTLRPVGEMRTPELVREFIDIKYVSKFPSTYAEAHSARGNAQHARLGEVVGELRTRGVLD